MLGRQFSSILARTDPFDVAQGLERHIQTLSGAQVRALIADAHPRMSEWYRAQFASLLDEPDDDRLKNAFAHALKTNLRAIPLFGHGFCDSVVAQIPGDRAVDVDEDGFERPMRVVPIIALLAFVLGAAVATGAHMVSTARARAQTPTATMMPAPLPLAVRPTAALKVHRPHPVAEHRPARTAQPQPQPPQPAAQVQQAAPVAAAAAPVSAPIAAPSPQARRTPPSGGGVKTVVAAPLTPQPSPTAPDTNDMPQAYSDATPLPKDEAPPSTRVPANTEVATPTPGPNRYWLHSTLNGAVQTIDRVNPFKRHRSPEPSASPEGPRPR